MKAHKLTIFMMILMAVSAVSCNKLGSGDWAVKIDDEVITMDEFNNFYYTQNKLLLNVETNEEIDKLAAESETLNPQLRQYLVKANFLDHLIAQRLLYRKAQNDNDINKNELKTISEIAKMQAVSTYYLGIKLKDEINVTDAEVEQFYVENRNLFKGVPMNDAIINRIKQQIFMQKSQIKSNEYIMGLLAESKVNKEGFKNAMKGSGKAVDEKKSEEKSEEKKEETPQAPQQ